MVKSSLGAAQSAVSGFKSFSQSGKSTTLGESNISGMKRAAKVSNQLVKNLSKLESDINKQADKFPKLASAIETRDRKDANDLSQMNWGF